MRVLCVENNNQSFRSIMLSKKAALRSEAVMQNFLKSDFSEKSKDCFYTELYEIFSPYLSKEAGKRAGVFYIKDEVLSELKIKFLEILKNVTQKTKISDIVSEINKYKPSKYTYKPECVYKSMDTPVYGIKGVKKVDLVTESDLPVPQSEVLNEYFKNKVNDLINETNLSEFQQKRLKKRSEGKTFKSIAEDDKVSVQVVKQAYRKSVLKIQRDKNVIPKEIKEKVKEFAEIIGCDEKGFMRAVMVRPDLLFYKPETLKNKISAAAEAFNCTEQAFIKAAVHQPSLFYQKTETLLNNVQNIAKAINCSEEEFVKAALRQPQLFCRKPEILKNNIKNSALALNCQEEDLKTTALRHPQLFYKKAKVLKNNAEKFSEFFHVSLEDSVRIMLKYPALFYRDLDKIKNRVGENAKMLNCTEKYFLEKALKNPILLCLSPDKIIKNYNIMNYYRKLQNTESNCLLPIMSDEIWYTKMLVNLINNSKGSKIIKPRNVSKSVLEKFLADNPEDNYSFEIQEGFAAQDLVNFAKEISEKTLGKNIFDIKILQK